MTLVYVLFWIGVSVSILTSVCVLVALLCKACGISIDFDKNNEPMSLLENEWKNKIQKRVGCQQKSHKKYERIQKRTAINDILTITICGDDYTVGSNISDMLQKFRYEEKSKNIYLEPGQFDVVEVIDTDNNKYRLGVYNDSVEKLLIIDCEVYAVAIARNGLKNAQSIKFKIGFDFESPIEDVILALGVPDDAKENGLCDIYSWGGDFYEYEIQVAANQKTGKIESVKML